MLFTICSLYSNLLLNLALDVKVDALIGYVTRSQTKRVSRLREMR